MAFPYQTFLFSSPISGEYLDHLSICYFFFGIEILILKSSEKYMKIIMFCLIQLSLLQMRIYSLSQFEHWRVEMINKRLTQQGKLLPILLVCQ